MLGMPIAQPTRRIKAIAPYTPLPWQVAPWRDKSPVLLLTGSAGGGKSRLAAEKIHGYLLKYSGAAGLVARKTRVSLTNSTIEQFKRNVIGPDPRVRHVPSKSRFEYANGSMLLYVGIEDEDQRERLRSIGPDGGIDIAWMEEATEFDEGDYNAVNGRIRGRAAPWRQLILTTNPDAPTHWIYRRLIVGGEAMVSYSNAADNPHNPADYHGRLDRLTGVDKLRLAAGQWVQAEGLVYGEVWSDGPADGNVTTDADYRTDGGPVLWAVDDGYAGERDAATGLYTATSHPRVFLLVQQRPDGRLCVFAERYAIKTLPDQHLRDVRSMGYPAPDVAVVDKSAATLKGHLHAAEIATVNGAPSVAESIKTLRGMLAPDSNGWRRILVHPRCRHLRSEFASYRLDPQNGTPIKAFDHGPDALRYLCWSQRYD